MRLLGFGTSQVEYAIRGLLQVSNHVGTKDVLPDSGSLPVEEKAHSRSSVTEPFNLYCLPNSVVNLASVHATLMVAKLVPSLLEELHFLLQLLSLEPAGSGSAKIALDSIAEINQEKGPLFANGDDCAGYATSVLEQAGRILDCGESRILAQSVGLILERH